MPTNVENLPSETEDAPTTAELVALDALAVEASIDLVAQATETDMIKPTPCTGWTLYGLLAHMATQHYGFAAGSRGDADPEAWKLRSLGDDPVSAYQASAEHLLEAFGQVGVLDRMFPLPEFSADQPFPAREAISFHLVDYVVHSWDVAKTLGATVEFEPDVVEAAHNIVKIVPTGAPRLAPGAAFGPVVPLSGGSRLDQLVAFLGRPPHWPH